MMDLRGAERLRKRASQRRGAARGARL